MSVQSSPTANLRGIRWRAGWFILTATSIAVGGYAIFLLINPSARPRFMIKSPYPLAVLAHLGGGGVSLLLGPWQFLTGVRGRFRALHRWSGRVYGLTVVVGGVAGLLLATVAQTGLVARLGFTGLAVAWLATLVMGVRSARRGAIEAHRAWMVRNFALTFAAVTLRLYLPASLASGIAFAVAYPIIAWLAWVPNLLVAELLIRRARNRACG